MAFVHRWAAHSIHRWRCQECTLHSYPSDQCRRLLVVSCPDCARRGISEFCNMICSTNLDFHDKGLNHTFVTKKITMIWQFYGFVFVERISLKVTSNEPEDFVAQEQ